MSGLRAEQLRLTLGGRSVLRGLSCELKAGEMLGVLGANGAGKTSLLRVLAGLLSPDAGQVLLDDRALSMLTPAQRAREIGYLPQSRECHWPLAVRELVTLGRLPQRAPWARLTAQDQLAIDAALGAADVTHLVERPITEISGGERARALLARVLAGEPRILLADEPTAGLDPAHQLQVMSLLRARAAAGYAVAVTLHDLTLAAQHCDRLLLLHEGVVLAEGSAETVFSDLNLETAYAAGFQRVRTERGWVVVPGASAPATASPPRRA